MSDPLRTLVIAIVGPSGSGKTWLAEAMSKSLSRNEAHSSVSLINEDAYYRDQSELSLAQRRRVNYDHPDALEHDLLLRQLQKLCGGESIQSPVYDYIRHTRSDERRRVDPAALLLIEGVHVLHRQELRSEIDFSIYLDTPLDTCLQRRIERDIRERGRSAASVRSQFAESVLPMYQRFVAPVREHADLVMGQSPITKQQIRELKERVDALLRSQGDSRCL